MEEEKELHYVAVTFRAKEGLIHDADVKTSEVIYDELKAEPQTETVTAEIVKDSELLYDEKKTQDKAHMNTNSPAAATGTRGEACSCVKPAAVSLGLLCVVLLSAVIALSLLLTRESSEHLRDTQRHSEEAEELRTELSRLQALSSDLGSARDQLNWTLSVIMKYRDFDVTAHCPNKVCQPCLDRWILFQSSCYFFSDGWKNWDSSRDECKHNNADLVTVQSQEEQEFLSNHTLPYHSNSGYWIGLRQRDSVWSWVDGSRLNVSFWSKEEPVYPGSCVLTLHLSDPLSTWRKYNCNYGNRWICETPALIKQQH